MTRTQREQIRKLLLAALLQLAPRVFHGDVAFGTACGQLRPHERAKFAFADRQRPESRDVIVGKTIEHRAGEFLWRGERIGQRRGCRLWW